MTDSPIFDQTPQNVADMKLEEAKQAGILIGKSQARTEIRSNPTIVIDNTPNERIENPDTRKVITKVAAFVGALLGTLIVIDLASPAFDLRAWTDPINAGFMYLTSFYGIYIALPNIPGKK